MIRKLFLILIIVFAVSTAAVLLRKNALPRTFTLNVSSDLTSPGGNRTYAASIKFQNGELVNGVSRYVANPGNGGHFTYDCVAKGPTWVYADSLATCDIPVSIPLTRLALAREIHDGNMKPMKQCGHLDICYEIVPE